MTIARINVAYCTFGINVSNTFSNTYLHMASLDSHARKSSKKKTKHFRKPFIIFSSGFNSHFLLCLIACFLTRPKWYIFKYPEIQSVANYLCCNGNCLCGLFYFQNPYSALFSEKGGHLWLDSVSLQHSFFNFKARYVTMPSPTCGWINSTFVNLLFFFILVPWVMFLNQVFLHRFSHVWYPLCKCTYVMI